MLWETNKEALREALAALVEVVAVRLTRSVRLNASAEWKSVSLVEMVVAVIYYYEYIEKRR